MNDEFQWWVLLVGMGIGAGLVWLFAVRLPRSDEDVDERERERESEWISATIEERGGVAPPLLVEEVLDLHARYLSGPPLAVPDDEGADDALEESGARAAAVARPEGPPERTRPERTSPPLRVDRSTDLPDAAR